MKKNLVQLIFMLLCFIILYFKSVSTIDKVSHYEITFFVLIDVNLFISFQVRISMVKRDRS